MEREKKIHKGKESDGVLFDRMEIVKAFYNG